MTASKKVFYAEAVYGEEEIAAVARVLREQRHALMGGPAVAAFEARVAALFGKRRGLMVNSGSSANLLALACLELAPGDEVITPALTFSTTVAPMVQLGLTPCFIDVEADTFNADAALVEDMIGARTRAVMVPNLIGNLADWPALREIAGRRGLVLIEDSCDTINSTIDGADTGALTDIATTSFYASHIITAAGFGGMACFNDAALSERATLLRGWGRRSSLAGESEDIARRFDAEVDGIPYDSKFIFDAVGYNFLASDVAAAFGLVQLDRLDQYTRRRIDNWTALRGFFAGHEEHFILPRQAANVRTPWLALPLIVRDAAPFTRRDLQIHFEGQGIQTRPVFTGNILRQKGFKDIPRREHPAGFANADRVMRGGFLLGCHQGMDGAQIDRIRDSFTDFIAKVG